MDRMDYRTLLKHRRWMNGAYAEDALPDSSNSKENNPGNCRPTLRYIVGFMKNLDKLLAVYPSSSKLLLLLDYLRDEVEYGYRVFGAEDFSKINDSISLIYEYFEPLEQLNHLNPTYSFLESFNSDSQMLHQYWNPKNGRPKAVDSNLAKIKAIFDSKCFRFGYDRFYEIGRDLSNVATSNYLEFAENVTRLLDMHDFENADILENAKQKITTQYLLDLEEAWLKSIPDAQRNLKNGIADDFTVDNPPILAVIWEIFENVYQTIKTRINKEYHSWSDIEKTIANHAPLDTPILIFGSPGSGKTYLAKTIHEKSKRTGNLQSINTAGLDKDKLRSELFGYKDGSFTGAKTNYDGLVRATKGGTIFLDEIGDALEQCLPMLLKFVGERTIEPIGEEPIENVDVKIIAATNMARQDFKLKRRDLYDRFYPIITMPHLKDRLKYDKTLLKSVFEDVKNVFLGPKSKNQSSKNKKTKGKNGSKDPGAENGSGSDDYRHGRKSVTLSEDQRKKLIDAGYNWPGEIRQLKKAIMEAIMYKSDLSKNKSILASDILRFARIIETDEV